MIDKNALEITLRKMYTDIDKYHFDMQLIFDEKKDAWVVQLTHEVHELKTYLERKDAEACIEGKHCVYLGVQIGQFVKNFEDKEHLETAFI